MNEATKQAGVMMIGTSSSPKCYAQPVATPIHYYIYAPVSGDIAEYAEMIHHLDCAMPGEVINIHLATPGGSMETAIAIVHAIIRSDAVVVAHADATVASAGTIIFLACNSWFVHKYSSFMFHDGSLGFDSMKFNETKKMIDFTTGLYKEICDDLYGKIMSDEEIEKILGGNDAYMKSEEMLQRLSEYADRMEAEDSEESPEDGGDDEPPLRADRDLMLG